MRRSVFVLLVVSCLLATVSCAPLPVYRPWVYADLRLLDPLDAPTAATDIVAVYTRTTDLSDDIRVDLLDITQRDNYNLRISLWDSGNFYQHPLTIDISSTGAVQTTGIGNGKPVIWPRVIQDQGLDTITVSLNRALIGERYHFDVTTYTTDPTSLADEAINIRSDAQPPVKRAPLLLAFWDTFPAVTPAQALRRWDGAHTGPLGGRHGLKYILDGAVQYNIPVALLDIKNPASLAALDFMGNTPQLQALDERGLLILPDVAYSEPADISLDFSRRAAAGFGLPASQFVYAASQDLVPGYRAQFLSLADGSHLAASGGMRLIPLPAAAVVEATAEGPSLGVRRALLMAAISPDPSDLVVLGGSLPQSTWGDSDMAASTFDWIASHPWIQPLNGYDLLAFPIGAYHAALPAETPPEFSAWLDDLRSAPENVITESAWQTYLMLTAPTTDVRLQTLREGYLGQLGELLVAARWAENPSDQANCDHDLNGDGQPECVLSNQKYFAILDPDGGRLSNLFYLDGAGPHQLIAPSSQFAVGLSDPSEWHPELGEAADPNVIPGAFLDNNSWGRFSFITLTGNSVVFKAEDGSHNKAFQLTQDGLEIFYRGNFTTDTRVPLAVDPQDFYFGPTQYRPALASHSWMWSLVSGISLEVRTDATFSAEGFNSSLPFLSLPENPNLDYPKGHYYPFPLSVIALQGNGNFSVEITAHSHK